MGISDCDCGGHIPLGPFATNRCDRCGRGPFGDVDADGTDGAHPSWWRGQDDGVAGAAMRWEEALTKPIPRPGVMREPLESLYRRTEALRQEIESLDNLVIKLGKKLSDTVNILRGPPPELTLWSTHDVPERAAAMRAELERIQGYRSALIQKINNLERGQSTLLAEAQQMRATLELIAAPKRPDGTYNRSREACEQLAKDTLAKLERVPE